MVYVNSRGEIADRPLFSWNSPVSIFWAILNFFALFFRTMFTPGDDMKKSNSSNSRSNNDGRGPRGGGFGGFGGSRGAPRCAPPAFGGG